MIDFKFLERLLELLRTSDAESIEITKRFWGTSIRVSKSSTPSGSAPVTYQVSAPPAQAPSLPAPQASPDAMSAPAPVADSPYIDVKSPMVGTFYAQPEPGADPYAKVGARITKGQTLCIIEAMKIMNPIEAEVEGVVVECVVEDAQPVEFGQVLFRVNPNG